MRRRDLLLIVTRLACRVLHVAPWFNRMEYAPRPICAHETTSYTIGVLLWGESQVVIRHVSVRASSSGVGCLECGPRRVCRLLAADDDGGDILRGVGVVVDVGHGVYVW